MLVIDDDPHNVLATRRALTSAGYETIVVPTATEAEPLWKAQVADVVVLDVNLPDGNGIELCHRWKQDGFPVPIILRSSVSVSAAEQALGLDSGANGYLTEPTDPEVLQATIDAHLRIKDLLEASGRATREADLLVDFAVAAAAADSPEEVLAALEEASGRLGACAVKLIFKPSNLDESTFWWAGRPTDADGFEGLATLRDAPSPLFVANRDDLAALGHPAPDGQGAWLVIPFRVLGLIGRLYVACSHAQDFDERSRRFFLTFTNLVALALAQASALQLQRSIATTLQSALLPAPDLVPGVEVERRLRVAPGSTLVGGDWYDAYPLEDGTQIVTIGDVVGHGPRAAGSSAAFRYTLRALLLRGTALADCLPALDRQLSVHGEPAEGTVLVMRIDADAGRVELVNGGHVAPLLLRPASAEVSEVEVVPLPPIGYGIAAGPAEVTTLHLRPGEMLFALTDGLVERRTAPIDEATGRLIELLRGAGSPTEAVQRVEAALAAVPALRDDALFLTVRI